MWQDFLPYLGALVVIGVLLWLLLRRPEPNQLQHRPHRLPGSRPRDVVEPMDLHIDEAAGRSLAGSSVLGEPPHERDAIQELKCSRCHETVPIWFVEYLTGRPEDVSGTTAARMQAQVANAAICRHCTETWRYPKPGETEDEYVEEHGKGRVQNDGNGYAAP